MNWKSEYGKLMFPIKKEESNVESAFEIKTKELKSLGSLFKYTRSTIYSLNNLKKDEVRLSCVKDFNDPFDSALTHNLIEPTKKMILISAFGQKLGKKEIEKLKKLKLEDAIKHLVEDEKKRKDIDEFLKKEFDKYESDDIKKKVEDMQASLIVSCFSEVKDSILMWSHYADFHKGFCIEYDFSEHDTFNSLHPIIYSDEMFNVSQYILDKKNVTNPLFDIYAAINKANCWSYEKEWRIIKKAEKSHNISVPKAKSIYLGAKIDNISKEFLMDIADSKGILVYQMELDPRDYKLNPIKVK